MPTSTAGSTDKLWPLISKLRQPVLTTRRSDGGLRSRPVAMQNRASDHLDFLWLFTARDSGQVEDLQWESSVSIVFAEAETATCVAVFGSAAVLEDLPRKKALWLAESRSGFAGPDDPGLALVRVRIIQADHWDVERNSAACIFKLNNSPLPPRVLSNPGISGALHYRAADHGSR